MKFLGTLAALLGALILMAVIIIVQRNYQRSWNDSVLTQQVAADNGDQAALDQESFASNNSPG
jgi:hypothetical protein